MLNPRQQAKLAVLKHLGKMMDDMMGSKLKGHKAGHAKPVAAHLEVDMAPKGAESPLGDEMHKDDEMAAPPSMASHGEPDADDEDMKMLHQHYSSLKD